MKRIITFLFLIMFFCSFSMNVSCFSNLDIEEQMNSQDYLLINLDNNCEVFEKNADKKIYPASMTKVMTAIIIIENTRNFNKEIILSNEDVALYEKGAAVLGLNPGTAINVNDALYGMLLASSADVAHAAAIHFAGTEAEFVKIMNNKAKLLNMNNTHFNNSTGMEDENHYTTLRDFSKLLKYCLKNKKFMEIQRAESYKINLRNQNQTYDINSYSKLLFKKHGFNPDQIIAAKTGYTYQAGDCMASVAKKHNMSFMFLSAEAPSYNSEVKLNILDAIKMYNYVFNNYHYIKCFDKNDVVDNITIKNDIYLTLPKNLDLDNCETMIKNSQLIIKFKGETIANYCLYVHEEFVCFWIYYLLFGIIFTFPYIILYFKFKTKKN